MSNELLLIFNLIFLYSAVVGAYYLFGKKGLTGFTVFATLAANIEVLIMVHAFGMDQTLGNIMFATTFVVTDILSEVEGKEASKEAVNLGIATSVLFICVSQLWLQFTPSSADWAMPSIQAIFSNTPRLMIAGLAVYAIAQKFDVWFYHKVWKLTESRLGDKRKYLWIRNNASTLFSQLINSFLFTLLAFGGTMPNELLFEVFMSSYVIFIVTSIADTPFVYLARKIKENKYS